MIDTRLTGKVAVVSGANHGIGAAIARGLAAQGARVCLTYFPLDEAGEHPYAVARRQDAGGVLASIRQAGGEAMSVRADLSQPDAIPDLFDRAEAAYGPVNVLVNNAAGWQADSFLPGERAGGHALARQSVVGVSEDSFAANFHVSTRATALTMAEFARRHLERAAVWGRVVNVSTDGAWAFPAEVSYGASKLAVEGLTRSAAVELGPYGITANVISPGPVQTGWIDAALEKQLSARLPLRRVGTPEDIADAAVFLCSHQARWISGQVISVGGGGRL